MEDRRRGEIVIQFAYISKIAIKEAIEATISMLNKIGAAPESASWPLGVFWRTYV